MDFILFNFPARDSVVLHNEIHAARPAQIFAGVDLVLVIAPAIIHPSIDVGERYRAFVRLVIRLDGRHPYKDGAGHDPLRAGNKPLALFGATSPKYSELGCFVITEFWCKAATLGPLTKAIAFSTPTEVDLVFEKDWKM
jgi:hypothetical protein